MDDDVSQDMQVELDDPLMEIELPFDTFSTDLDSIGIPISNSMDSVLLEECFDLLRTSDPLPKTTKVKKACSICSKEVFQLHKHILIHDNSKRITCAQCGKRFVQKSNLNRHIRDVHRPPCEKFRFNCDYCEYETNRSDKFRIHEKSHRRGKK